MSDQCGCGGHGHSHEAPAATTSTATTSTATRAAWSGSSSPTTPRLSGTSCGNVALAYETTNGGQGWYQFHHHHAHISLKNATFTEYVLGCENPFECNTAVRSIPKRPTVHRLRPAK